MRAQEILAGARRIAVLTGAGVSTESGVPDFRGPAGVWSRFDPGEFEFSRLLSDPRRFWTLRAKLMREFDLASARPNAAHVALAEAARGDRLLGIATQNIDGLHTAAATPAVKLLELHGNAANVRCLRCGVARPYEAVRAAAESGRAVTCALCGDLVKPDVVLFGEPLPAEVLAKAERWARSCDAFLAVGTSLSVWPAAGLALVAKEEGAALVVVNEGPTDLDAHADARVDGRAATTLPALLRAARLVA